MGLKLEKNLPHQTEAIDRINQVFENVQRIKSFEKYANPIIDLESPILLENIKKINNTLPPSLRGNIGISDYLNIDIKMETGTGKTFVYTETIFALNKKYGIHKFIILVPSLPIKLGTANFIKSQDTISLFKDKYGKNIDLYILNAKNNKKNKESFPNSVRSFVETTELLKNRISVLLVNMQLFKEKSILTKNYTSTVEDYSIPCEALKATKPFIIIDEPHRFAKSNKTFEFINNRIKPQCIIRFGATFPDIKKGKTTYKDYNNLIYNLGSCEAFNSNLIKGINIKCIGSPNSNNKILKVLELNNKKSVKIRLVSENSQKTYELEKGESLKQIDSSFENIYIEGIGKYLILSNGQILKKGDKLFANLYATSYQAVMIENALEAHFKTEKENFKRKNKIKTLALFFIDDIDSYRPYKNNPQPAYLKDIFENILKKKILKELNNINKNDQNEILYEKYLKETLKNISKCHDGYFARDNNDSDENIAESVKKILINKEETLSLYDKNGDFNIFRFIFSKWTLKEGWDNPNVFTIAKLRSSGSEISKLQEVGRGLRLPVNENLARVSGEQFYLNYIVDFTEKDFAENLINEINGDIVENKIITTEQIDYVSKLLNKTQNELFIELLSKEYIDMDKNIIIHNREKFLSEYPDFNIGLRTGKIVDDNVFSYPKSRIRKNKFEEIKELWKILNRKFFISYSNFNEKEIITQLFNILKNGVAGNNEIISYESKIITDELGAHIEKKQGVEYEISNDFIPYNVFLKNVNNSTNIPIKLIHQALIEYNKTKIINNDFFNKNTLLNFINKINEWKKRSLFGKLKYTSIELKNKETALTDQLGNPKEYVLDGTLGVGYCEEYKPSDNYLYDICIYDSELEKKNIIQNNTEVTVFGKIPSRSIRIPLVNGESYSPDFMYIIKKENNLKELNLVIETKDYLTEDGIPPDQKYKIKCAERFFEQLQAEGFNVKFKLQIKNTQLSAIIKNL